MKAKIGKQEAAYNAVKKHRQENPDATLKQAMIVVAKKTKSTNASVQAAYYTHARRNGDAIAARAPRNTATKVAPPKKTTTKKTKQTSANVDLNVVRVSLAKAMDVIQVLEDENNKNREIINDLRHALSV
jgi:hypothetical protein